MRLATIGTSSITEKFVDAFCSIEGNIYEAVYSRTLSKARAFQKLKKSNKAYDNLDEMLNDSEIDIVYIASPNALHVKHCKAALKEGKHVLCEKPIAISTTEMDELYKLAVKHNCFIFETITTVHIPNYNILKNNLNKIGQIKMIRSDLSQFSNRYINYKKGIISNVFNPIMCGGAFLDLGVYCIHLTVGLFGNPESVVYDENIGFNGIDTSGGLLLRYPHMLAVLTFGKDTYSENATWIQGDKGYFKILGPASRLSGIEWHSMKEIKNIGESIEENHLVYEVRNISRIIKNNDEEGANLLWEHSRNVVKVIEVALSERIVRK